jgi:hypothetical protein
MRTVVCNLCGNELELENGRAQKYEPELPGQTLAIGSNGATKRFKIHVEARDEPDTDLCDECFRAIILVCANALARQAAGDQPACLEPRYITFSSIFDDKAKRFAEMYGGFERKPWFGGIGISIPIRGTATGRHSSGGPDMVRIPKRAK